MRRLLTCSTRPAEKLNLLAIGLDVTPLVASINRAGYNAYSIDYFGDSDVQRLCKESLSIITQIEGVSCGRLEDDFNPEKLLNLYHKMLKLHRIDGVLLASGLEDSPNLLSSINDDIPFLGNNPSNISKVRNKEQFFQTLKRLGIPHPETELVEDLQGAKKKAKDIGYPIIIKPEKGFGGIGVHKVSDPKHLISIFNRYFPMDQRILIQEFIPGKAASASLLSTGEKVCTLTVNEQLLGMSSLGQREMFGYCGNIVPLASSTELRERCSAVAERVISTYSLLGSTGVDFVISDEGIPMVVEVNPRFQGSLECVERVLGINMVQAHVDACNLGILPDSKMLPRSYWTRVILFAHMHSKIPDLQIHKEIRDMPIPGVIVESGEPLCSVIIDGSSREASLSRANSVAKTIFQSLLVIPD
jgi:predicted ATP-grasp superfamily ATP-dependent carboligase